MTVMTCGVNASLPPSPLLSAGAAPEAGASAGAAACPSEAAASGTAVPSESACASGAAVAAAPFLATTSLSSSMMSS